MPTDLNLRGNYPGLAYDRTVRSLRVWLYASPWDFDRSQLAPPAPPDGQAEVAADQAHFVCWRLYEAANQRSPAVNGGPLLPIGLYETRQSVADLVAGGDLETLFAIVFGTV